MKKEKGIICPKCGAARLKVEYTRHRAESIRRVRRCKDCGRRFPTVEKPV
jgi:transcriptional regulator NrdR family protein